MLLSTFRQFPRARPVYKLDKRYIKILPTSSVVGEGCYNALEKCFNFINLHGPSADEVTKDIDLTGKTCFITGANSGIGLEMARCLSARNCSVLMACRNTYEASGAVKTVCEKPHLLQFYETNLASLKSVKNTSDELLKLDKKLDIVILNAGVFGLPWTLTDDGLETTFQVNYLSQYFLLMNMEHMLAPDARVVFMSSESHRNINWSITDALAPHADLLSLPKDQYTSIKAYNVSKLCCILAMHYLGYRWLNTNKQVFCAHPGSFVKTKLCRNWWVYEAIYNCMRPFSKSISQAAATPLYCATSPDLDGLSALYYKDCKRCAESDLAKDYNLSFRLQDLTYDLLYERISLDDKGKVKEPADFTEKDKDQIVEPLISTYSA